MITEYTIAHGVYDADLVTAQYEKKLEDEVNRLIKDGWQPYGPLASSSNGDVTIFAQPMVRMSSSDAGVDEGVLRQVDSGVCG